METKTFEVMDAGTFMPVLGVRLDPSCERDRWLLARSGFGRSADDQRRYVMLTRLAGGEMKYDPHAWPGGTRTMSVAHEYIVEHWDELEIGALVDVEFILGISAKPKRSEAGNF